MELDQKTIAKFIDHTNVKPDATEDAIKKLVDEAKENGFKSVCVTPYRTRLSRELLGDNSPVGLICVIGFPYGFTTTEEKVNEAKTAVNDGATEIDMVINIGAVKDGDWDYAKQEIAHIAKSIAPIGLKVILEIGFLTHDELVKACQITKEAGAAFVKTSTGFGPRTPTVEDIKIMRQTVGDDFGVKASGGIHTFEQAKAMIEAGATRIGSSSGLQIIGIDEPKEKDKLSKE